MAARVYSPKEMLSALVAFDTTSRDSNLELIRFVQSYLLDHGVESTLVFNPSQTKANLVATVGPQDTDGGVVLSGHSDVVPVDGQDWSSAPFELSERGGRLYGRGTCDMKGFIAIALALVPEFLRSNLKVPVHIVLTYDEETDCSGAQRLMETFPIAGLSPRAVIIGEPTEMRVVNAHKGHYCCETRVTGCEAHSSLPGLGVNAIDVACQLVRFLGTLGDEARSRPCAIKHMHPPYTTINVGVIGGGQQFNIVPGECRFSWDIRTVPGQDPNALVARFNDFAKTLLPAMREICSSAGIDTVVTVSVPAFEPQEDSQAESLVKHLAQTNESVPIAFGTEAPCYQQAGMSVVVFGPGSIEQAHKPDEFLSVGQLEAGVDFVRALMSHLSE